MEKLHQKFKTKATTAFKEIPRLNKRENESSDLQKLGERIDKKYAAKRLEVNFRNEHIKKRQSEFRMQVIQILLSIGIFAGVVWRRSQLF